MKKTLREYLTSTSNKRKLYLLLILLLATLLLFTACGKKEGNLEGDKSKSNQTLVKEEEEKELSLAELKKAGEKVYEYSYDFYVFVNDDEVTYQRIWVKAGKSRSEMDLPHGMGRQVTIIKDKEAYLYQPDLKQASKMSAEMAGVDQDFESPATYFDKIDEARMIFLSNEIFDGKECLLYQIESPAGMGRIWIWEEKKMVLRSELETPGGDRIVSEFLNFLVGPVDDAVFDLPQDTQIIDLANLMPRN